MRIQTAPAKRWTERERLGAQGGGMNGGIFVVSDKNKRGYIEKRMQRRDIEHQIAEREITALQRVGHHPYITTMVDHFIDYRRGEASIYLERCTGSSLQRLIERHARNHNEMIAEYYLWNWFMQIAEALSYCHYGPRPDHPPSRQSWNSIYHRDVKPANILLTRIKEGPREGEVIAQLADLGCSRTKADSSQGKANPLFQSILTRDFAPPESPRYLGQSDVWQLGAVMVCLCNLTMEFKRGPLRTHPESPAGPKYSRKLNLMIKECMLERYDERPKSDRILGLLQKTYRSIEDDLPRGPEPLLPTRSNTSGRRQP
ncbi:kinase-like protein [Melanomma pulvis-pyrius CBS 109.77]|uniref:non-specific serine/threonine protein kinase n=1 Tax=Melanomma pulvis-pyrius CBS 109.77 TaxID=1314802 RepID=A0A6A6XVH1_9PLEO|nr:kinase-like protein [Melanomma pulvis-pyrius CBS 109.77]